MNETLTFLPWLRRGLGGGYTLVGDDPRPRLTLQPTATARSTGDSEHEACDPVWLQLAGPGEVRTLDSRMIVRTWPPPGSRDAPSNHLPLVELRDPDLPWRYSPEPPVGDRLHPWLTLLVLKVATAGIGEPGEFQWRPRANKAPLRAVLVQEGTPLPDLTQSWAWAHTQLIGSVTAADVPEASQAPSALSRILAPRLLEPNRQYAALLVPTYERGRLAGLGRAPGQTPGKTRAWVGTTAPAGIELPVLYQWSFSTSASPLDFEKILDDLVATEAPDGLGTRPLQVSLGGLDLSLPLAGALTPVGHTQDPPAERAALMNALDQDQDHEQDARPMVRPPTYAATHARRALDLGAAELGWLEELNLDPRWRVVAGLGVEVVRRHQEAYMAAAWEVVGEVRRLNERLAAQQVAYFGLRRVHSDLLLRGQDRVRKLMNLRPLGDARFDKWTSNKEVLRAFKHLGEPQLLRIARPQGALGRRAGLRAPSLMASRGTSLAQAALQITSRALKAPSLALNLGPLPTIEIRPPLALDGALDGTLDGLNAVSAEAVELGMSSSSAVFTGTSAPSGAGHSARIPLSFSAEDEEETGSWLETLAFTLEQTLPAPAEPAADEPSLCEALIEALTELASTLDPDQSVASKVQVHLGDGALWRSVQAAPRFEDAVSERLEELGTAWFLPGLSGLQPEHVTCVQTNPAFVEAFLAGMNHELARELRWREYPTDQRGTSFARFWRALSPAASPDIADVHVWRQALGKNPPAGSGAPKLVLLFRSVLFTRYPGTRLSLLRSGAADEHGFHAIDWSAERVFPAFDDRMGEYAYFGFDLAAEEADDEPGWFVVFEEQSSQPRFGADLPSEQGGSLLDEGAAHWNNLTWAHIFGGGWETQRGRWVDVTQALQAENGESVAWANSAADLACQTFQMPVRRAIHLSDLLPSETRRPRPSERPPQTFPVAITAWRPATTPPNRKTG